MTTSPAAVSPAAPLVDVLAELRAELAALPLRLDTPGGERARRERDAVVGQVEDYLLPRLRQIEAPLLVVVGGSTGAGKSTLVNTLVGAEVSRAGVLRPTTRGPVLVCAPPDLPWFTGERVLPGLARTTGEASDARSLRIVGTPALTPGLALLDAPDIDSVVAANRELAVQLLAAADLWLFVTTAARYADAVPWDMLRTAAARSTGLAVVLNRIPPGAAEEILPDLTDMLASQGLAGTPLLAVPETTLQAGALPAAAAQPVRQWLDELAADADARAAVVRGTLRGALDSLPPRVALVAAAADEQAAALTRLRGEVDAAYRRALEEVEDGVRAGSLLRGEVLARWQEFVGTGQFMASLESRIGAFRDRVWNSLTGRTPPAAAVNQAVENTIEDVVAAAADAAAERLSRSWAADPAGRSVLRTATTDLSHAGPGLRERIGRQVREWQSFVLGLVSSEGADKRTAARVASLGINGAGLAAMLGVFAHTGGLTGGEVAVAGGTSIAGQRLLEAVFGDEAVRRLAQQARVDLVERVRSELVGEAARFTALLDAAGMPEGDRLRERTAVLAAARRAAALG